MHVLDEIVKFVRLKIHFHCSYVFAYVCSIDSDDNDAFSLDVGNVFKSSARYSGMWICWRTLSYSN